MWVVETSFGAAPERLAARPAHRERLTKLHGDGMVRMAGPFADESGSMMIFDVADRVELDRLLAADPYLSAPGVTIVSIREWSPFLT